MHLRRQFENFGTATKTLVNRLSRGVFREDRRPAEARIRDARGRVVRSIGTPQTFLNPDQVTSLVAMYQTGASVRDVAEHFGVAHTTALAHLKRQSVPMRRRGLPLALVPEAAQLYRDECWTLMEIGLKFGVSAGAVRRAIGRAGVVIGPRGRRPTG